MKKCLVLSFLLAVISGLYGCAKEEAPARAAANAQAAPATAFLDTRRYGEGALQALAKQMLLQGRSIDGEAAEKCLRTEGERRSVREACALLWATGDSPARRSVEDLLLQGAGDSPAYATALIKRPGPLSTLSLPDLFRLCKPDYPAWIDAGLFAAWVSAKGGLGDGDFAVAKEHFSRRSPDSPAALHFYGATLFRYRPADFDALTRTYCDSASRGAASLRCWRYAAALLGSAGDPELVKKLSPYLGRADDPRRGLLQRNFPRSAAALASQLPEWK